MKIIVMPNWVDPVTGERRIAVVSCDVHESLKQPINVKVTGLEDLEKSHFLTDGADFPLYMVSVTRSPKDIVMRDTVLGGTVLAADETRRLDRVDGDAKIVLGIALGDGDDLTPGVTYRDTLTVHVEPVE